MDFRMDEKGIAAFRNTGVINTLGTSGGSILFPKSNGSQNLKTAQTASKTIAQTGDFTCGFTVGSFTAIQSVGEKIASPLIGSAFNAANLVHRRQISQSDDQQSYLSERLVKMPSKPRKIVENSSHLPENISIPADRS